jgi:hypothetical protein
MATIQELVDKLQTLQAKEGDPITPDYHNTLRDAVVLLAKQPAGGGVVTGPRTFSFAPVFSPLTGGISSRNWSLALGLATNPAKTTVGGQDDWGAAGWFGVQLPDNLVIDGMTVRGTLAGPSDPVFQITLLRQGVSTSSITTLVVVSPTLGDVQQGQFAVTRKADLAAELLKVDNSKFKYLVQAQLAAGSANVQATIFSVQITGSIA